MSTDDVEVIVVDSDDEEAGIIDCHNTQDNLELREKPCDSLSDGLVSARTDGICGKRYLDYEFELSSETESGELTDSDVDIVSVTESKGNEWPDNCKNDVIDIISACNDEPINKDLTCTAEVLDEGTVCSDEVLSSPVALQRQSNSNIWKLDEINIRTDEDVKGILSHIKTESVDQGTTYDGISKLLSDHRQINPVIADSSDDEEHGFEISDSESEDGSDYKIPLSVTSEVNRMAGMNIKDHPFMETYPEVEIVDLTLSECELITPLGKIYKIVEDFVVVNSCNCDKVLDLDSMIFDESRKCVGYVFEVLGPVKEPYYSIRFNTNSDIENFGLHLHQELFYSPNERYSRYVMVDLLRELEYNSRFRKTCDDDPTDSCDSGNSESENEELTGNLKTPVVGTKRKPKGKTLQNRTTSNYSVNYQSVHKQPKHHYNSFVDQLKTVSYVNPRSNPSHLYGAKRTFSDQWQNASIPKKPSDVEKKNSDDAMSYDTLCSKVERDQNRKAPTKTQVNSFKSSVLSSFLDPFSLDKPDD